MNLFRVKRSLLEPYVRVMRGRERHQPAFARNMLEAQYYRPTFYRWIEATLEHRDILFDFPLEAGSTVVDVGAHRGDWTHRIRELYDCRVDMFELDPPSVNRLRERFGADDQVRLFEFGLHHQDATLELFQKGPGSTTFAESPKGEQVPVVSVPLRDAAVALRELDAPVIDLLKLNIEGGEYPVLERLLQTGWLPKIRLLIVQFHEWPDGSYARRRRIRRGLGRSHDLVWDYPFVWEYWRLRDEP